ncbi:hypothetical protein PENSPDRAFT_260217 [Peniophora sp. CONT]|nr:hypothetical protein PENSPDRAFT_260217 [Peniophora sp. CONT]
MRQVALSHCSLYHIRRPLQPQATQPRTYKASIPRPFLAMGAACASRKWERAGNRRLSRVRAYPPGPCARTQLGRSMPIQALRSRDSVDRVDARWHGDECPAPSDSYGIERSARHVRHDATLPLQCALCVPPSLVICRFRPNVVSRIWKTEIAACPAQGRLLVPFIDHRPSVD